MFVLRQGYCTDVRPILELRQPCAAQQEAAVLVSCQPLCCSISKTRCMRSLPGSRPATPAVCRHSRSRASCATSTVAPRVSGIMVKGQ